MSLSDPVADFLTRIRNATRMEHRFVDMGLSKIREELAKILKKEGFISDYKTKIEDGKGTIRLLLRYTRDRESIIQGLKRVSRPGLRRYVTHKQIPRVLGGMGIAILTTSQGLKTGTEARKAGVGGELLCFVW